MAEVSVARPIRSSFDLWSGVPASEIIGSATCDSIKQQRHSRQLDPQISLQLSYGSGLSEGPFSQGELSPEAAELLMLLQAQQLAAGDDAPSADEIGIDAQIQRLMQLKQFLRRSKQQQQQQQQVILEDIALASQNVNGIDNTTSALFTSSALTTPLQSESLLNGSTAEMHNSWANLSSARAAAQPSRRSVDLGGLAQQLAALELRQNAAAAALADSQGLGDLATNLRSSMSFTNGMNNRLSIDCGLAEMNDNLVAAAAMAAQAEASRRTSLCLSTPQMSGLLDSMLLDNMAAAAQLGAAMPPMQAHDAASAGAALAMQSALYAPAAPALDTQLQAPVATAGLAGMTGMTAALPLPSPAAGRHSLDCSLLGLAPGVMGLPSPGPGHPSGMPSPMTGRASLNLTPAPLLADRGYALAQAQQAAQSDAAGWGFASRRGRASCDVRRQSSDLIRSSTPDQRQPPRKSVSLITPSASTCSSAASSSSSGRSSPRGHQQAARRTSLDKPPTCQPPKWSPPGPPASPAPLRPTQAAASDPAAAANSSTARKGTGVFIPSCLIKS